MTSDEFSDIEQLDENLRKWFKEKWVRFGPDGKIRGACARGDDSEGKPKCLPQKKAQNLGKKGRKYAASKKRREDPNPERTGKAKNVATKKKTNEGVPFNECPKCRGPIVHESMMTEKQDACYHKVKSRYKVWPSAYASGALVQCRKKGAKNWGTGGKKNESSIMKGLVGEAAYETDLNDNEPRVVIGVYGAKSKEFRKKFPNQQAQDRFFDHPDRKGNFEIHYVQKANMAEGVIIGHDKDDPEVAVLGGAGSYNLSNLKKKAHSEATMLANDISKGSFKSAAYNVKQLANTLETIKAAEDEMEKSYFGEDRLTEGWKMGTLGTIAGIVLGPAVAYSMFGDINDQNGAQQLLVWLGSMIAGGYFGKDISSVQDLIDRFTKNPVEFKKMIKQRKSEKKKNKRASEKSSAISVLTGVISQIDLVIQATNNKQYKKAANIFSSGDLNPGMLGLFPNLVYALENLSGMEETTLVIPEIRYALDVYEKFKTSPNDYAPEFIQALGEFKQYLMNRIQEAQIDEDYTGMFAAEKTAATNPYGGQTDRQYRGALGEDYKTRPITPALRAAQKNMAGLASGEIQRQEKQRKADEKAQRQASQYLDRVLNRKPAKKSKQDLETLWAKIESVIANSFPDGDPYDSLWPYMQKNGFTQDDVERASKMHGYDDLWDYWNTLTQDIENDAYYDWHATGGKNVRTRGTFVETPTDNPTGASGEGGWRRTDLDEYREMSPELRAAQKNLIALRNKEKSVNVSGKRERVSKEPSTDDKPKPASVLTKGAQEVDPAVADAIAAFLAKGGEIKKGRPGKAPPTGRQQASKHIGGGGKYRKRSDTPGQGANYRGAAIVAVEEEQLDEKCWTGYKQVGMKKKGGRQVPNCVQKESAIMKGLKRESK
jgi:hypothetical protein